MKLPATAVCPPIDRVAIAWVCVATNDAHPLHLDPDFARAAGFKDVVVPAHLLIGWVGQYLQEWCGGPGALERWSLRFSAPVWPGDRLELAGEPVEPASASAAAGTAVRVVARNQDGVTVGVATAVLRVPVA